MLCYGHYDVQPPDPLEQWHSPPFEPTVRDGNIYARGSADDKGQMYMHIKAVEALRAVQRHAARQSEISDRRRRGSRRRIDREVRRRESRQAEGRRRAGLRHRSFTPKACRPCASDCAAWSTRRSKPRGPARDLHSGLYGGAAPNAVFGLVELLSQVKDANGTIQIPGMYDDVAPPAPAEKRELGAACRSTKKEFLKNEVGVDAS